MVSFMRADFDVSCSWYDRLCPYAARPGHSPEEQKQLEAEIRYLDIACLVRSADSFADQMPLIARGMDEDEPVYRNFIFPVTSGLPSIINGGHDSSIWTLGDAALYREFAKPVERALGADGVCLPDCAIAESALLRGEDVRARMLGIASKIQDIYLHGSPDIEFAATGLLART